MLSPPYGMHFAHAGYMLYSRMDEPLPPLFDREQLVREIAEAIRGAIREYAEENGISYADAFDRCLGRRDDE